MPWSRTSTTAHSLLAEQVELDVLSVPGVADRVFQQIDDDLLDEHGLHGQEQDVLGEVQLHIGSPGNGGG